jgi:TonB family protein
MQRVRNQPTHSRRSRLQRVIVSSVLLVIAATAPADTLSRLSDVFTYTPKPRYPADASWRSSTGWRRVEGRTVCRVTLNADGTVARVEVADTSGSKILDHASVEALREWRAKPGRAGRYYNIPIRFSSGGSALGDDNGMGKNGLGMMKSRDR